MPILAPVFISYPTTATTATRIVLRRRIHTDRTVQCVEPMASATGEEVLDRDAEEESAQAPEEAAKRGGEECT